MAPAPLNEVFKLGPGPVPVSMFVRVALAVGVAMIGLTLAGQPLAAPVVASSLPGMALNPAMGFACMICFMVLAVDLLRRFTDGPAQLVPGLLYDVALGETLAVVGTLVAGAWHRSARRDPQAR